MAPSALVSSAWLGAGAGGAGPPAPGEVSSQVGDQAGTATGRDGTECAGQLGLVGGVRVKAQVIALEEGLLGGQAAGLVVAVGEFPSQHLGPFHIGLIKGVDPDQGAGHRAGELPAEEFSPPL